MNRCKTCKWWKPLHTFADHYAKMKSGVCLNDGKVGSGDSETDGVGTYDDLWIGPGFGCVHWEQKEQVEP
jgi:hypothetical protein